MEDEQIQHRYFQLEREKAAIQLICGEVDISTWCSYSGVRIVRDDPRKVSPYSGGYDYQKAHDDYTEKGDDAEFLKELQHDGEKSHQENGERVLITYKASSAKGRVVSVEKENIAYKASSAKGRALSVEKENITSKNTADSSAEEGSGDDNTTQTPPSQKKTERYADVLSRRRKQRKGQYSRKGKTFDDNLRELKKFKKIHGHCDVPLSNDRSLGLWCTLLRTSYKKLKMGYTKYLPFKLTPPQIKALDDMGFRWTKIDKYQRRLSDLVGFKTQHGHCDVPIYTGLGVWCNNLRLNYPFFKKGKAQSYDGTLLTEERVNELQALGFDFNKGAWQPTERKMIAAFEKQQMNELVDLQVIGDEATNTVN